jgi:hypothetical protein
MLTKGGKTKMAAVQQFKRGSHLVKSRINARHKTRRKARKLGKEVIN